MNPSFRSSLFGLVFFWSGFSSLIYQIAWQRLFTLYYGVGAVWVTLTVSVYMAGLGFGSLLGGWLAEGGRNNARLYCWVEFCLGVFALASVPLLRSLGPQTAGSGFLVSFFCIACFLLIPTVLMGTTLPILTKLFCGVQPDLSLTVSRLYCLNTLGAACGSLLSSFVLISIFGLDTAIYCGAVINLLLAGVVWLMSSNPPLQELKETKEKLMEDGVETGRSRSWVVLLALTTGFLAIGYEIVWARLVAVLVKDSPYAFSTILFVYLLGIALGSFVLGWLLPRLTMSRASLLLWLQGGIGLYTLASVSLYYGLTRYTWLAQLTQTSFLFPRHPQMPGSTLSGIELWVALDIFAWPAYFILVPTALMGASFPLLADLIVEQGRQGQAVARAYFVTILGNVSGGLVTGFVLLPLLGTERCLLVFGITNLLALTLLGQRAVLVATVALALSFFPGPGQLYLLMHRGKELSKHGEAYLSEGVDGVVVTFVKGDSVLNYIGGQSHGGRPVFIFHALAVEALTVPRHPKRVLVIGYGTGSFLETVLRSKELEKVTVVELNQTLLDNLTRIPLFQPLLHDPRLELVHEDGRRYLLNSREKFDAVFLDPVRTTTAYSNNLYSRDFFELVRQHLGPDSAFLVWHDQPRVIPFTVRSVFKETRQFAKFMVASPDKIELHEERRQQLLESFSVQDRQQITAAHLEPLADSPPSGFVNSDYKPVSEYYCGLPVREFLARLGL